MLDSLCISSSVAITSNIFIGNLIGAATTSTFLANASNILTGTINPLRLSGFYDIGVTTSVYLTNASNILSGIGMAFFPYEIDPAFIARFNPDQNKGNGLIDISSYTVNLYDNENNQGVCKQYTVQQ